MSREDNVQHQKDVERNRHAAQAPFMRRMVVAIQRFGKKVLGILGVGGALDIVKEFLRGKLMDRIVEYLGGMGQWLEAYPLAFLTLSLILTIVLIVAVTVKESVEAEESVICDEHGVPYRMERIARPYRRKLLIAAGACVVIIGYGTYRYYQIAAGHFKATNYGITMPDSAVLNGRAPSPPLVPKQAPSLSGLFGTDFPGFMKEHSDLNVEGIDLPMKQQVYLDFIGRSKFVGFYIPPSNQTSAEKTVKMSLMLTDAVESMLSDFQKKLPVSGGFGFQMNATEELVFTGRVMLYHEDILSIIQQAEIMKAYKAKKFDVEFRGQAYLAYQTSLWLQSQKEHQAQ